MRLQGVTVRFWRGGGGKVGWKWKAVQHGRRVEAPTPLLSIPSHPGLS